MGAKEKEKEGSLLCAAFQAPRGREAGCQLLGWGWGGGHKSSACNSPNTNAAEANFTEFHSVDSSLSQDSSAWEISSLEMEKNSYFKIQHKVTQTQ